MIWIKENLQSQPWKTRACKVNCFFFEVLFEGVSIVLHTPVCLENSTGKPLKQDVDKVWNLSARGFPKWSSFLQSWFRFVTMILQKVDVMCQSQNPWSAACQPSNLGKVKMLSRTIRPIGREREHGQSCNPLERVKHLARVRITKVSFTSRSVQLTGVI